MTRAYLKDYLVESPKSQYAIFKPLHSNISKEQHERISAIHSDIMENEEDSPLKHTPFLSAPKP